MARNKTILQSEYPYSISARCINKEWFRIPIEHVWKIFEEELYICSFLHNLKIHSFVLMNNHFHLIATTPDSNIDICMHRFMGATSRRLTKAGNRINQTYAGRYYKTILNTHAYFMNAYKYIYLNPVKAGITNRAENYRFSTLHGLLGQSYLLIPIEEDVTLFSSIEKTLEWINHNPSNEQWEAVSSALQRQFFKSKIDRRTRRPVLADNQII